MDEPRGDPGQEPPEWLLILGGGPLGVEIAPSGCRARAGEATRARRDDGKRRRRETITLAEEAPRICTRPEHLRRTARIALVVGIVLTLINQADVIARGNPTSRCDRPRQRQTLALVKVEGNFVVPFIVSNLGLLARQRAEGDAEPSSRGDPSGPV